MITETKRLSQLPEEHLLKDLRNLETKMGFVLTLVSPSTFYRYPSWMCVVLTRMLPGDSSKLPSGAS